MEETSKEEFYEIMHPGYKHPFPLASAKAAKEQTDVEVEIPDDGRTGDR